MDVARLSWPTLQMTEMEPWNEAGNSAGTKIKMQTC